MNNIFGGVIPGGDKDKSPKKMFSNLLRERDRLTEEFEHSAYRSVSEYPAAVQTLLNKAMDTVKIIKNERKFRDKIMKSNRGILSVEVKSIPEYSMEGLDMLFLRPGCYWQGMYRIRNALYKASSATDINKLIKLYLKFCDFYLLEGAVNPLAVANLKIRMLLERLVICSKSDKPAESTVSLIMDNLNKLWFLPIFSEVACHYMEKFTDDIIGRLIRIINHGMYDERVAFPGGIASRMREIEKQYRVLERMWTNAPQYREDILRFLPRLSLETDVSRFDLFRRNKSEISRNKKKMQLVEYRPGLRLNLQKAIGELWSGNYWVSTENQHKISQKILNELSSGDPFPPPARLLLTYRALASKKYGFRILNETISENKVKNTFWIVDSLVGVTFHGMFPISDYADKYLLSEDATSEGILRLSQYIELTKRRKTENPMNVLLNKIQENAESFVDKEKGDYINNIVPKAIEYSLEVTPEIYAKEKILGIINMDSADRMRITMKRLYKKLYPFDDTVDNLVM